MKFSFFIFSFLIALSVSALDLEEKFSASIDGAYNFQDVVCQNNFEKETDEYNAFKLKTEHGYKMVTNQLFIEEGQVIHKAVIKSGLFGTCRITGSGTIDPLSYETSDEGIFGFANLNVEVPKKYNKKTKLGCHCKPLKAVCKVVIPYIKQQQHRVFYEIDNDQTISFTQDLDYDDEAKTIESKDNFKPKFRKYCAKKGSDAPPTNIFKVID